MLYNGCPQTFSFHDTRYRGAKYRIIKSWFLVVTRAIRVAGDRLETDVCPRVGCVDPINCQEVLRGPSFGNSSSSRVISHTLFHSSHPTTETITYALPGFRTVRERPAFTTDTLLQ
jgi:hypothetical protein